MDHVLKRITLETAELSVILAWWNLYLDIMASQQLGFAPAPIEQQIAETIQKAIATSQSFMLTELDADWILTWADTATRPTQIANNLCNDKERAVLLRIETLVGK